MKISKALLKTIAVAVAVGVTQASCTKIEEELLQKKDESSTGGKCGVGEKENETFDCPACGMG